MLVRMWSNKNCNSLLVEMPNGTATLGNRLWFLTKLNVLLPYDSEILLLGVYPKESKTYVHPKICTWMFIAALFIIAKTWKQPRCPWVDERIN